MRPKPWDKLPDESEKAYTAFRCFLELDPENRSVVTAYNAYRVIRWKHHDREVDKKVRAPTYFSLWERQHNWKERVSEYDAERRKEILEKTAEKRKDLAVKCLDAFAATLTRQLRGMPSAGFDERTRFMNSLRESMKTFHIDEGGHSGVTVVIEAGSLRDD